MEYLLQHLGIESAATGTCKSECAKKRLSEISPECMKLWHINTLNQRGSVTLCA